MPARRRGGNTKTGGINETFARIGMFVVGQRFPFLLLVALCVLLGILGTRRLVFNSSNESFFPETGELIVHNHRFREIFGNEEFVFILVEGDDIFQTETLGFVRSLSLDLERNLPFADAVLSITEVEHVAATGDTLDVADLVGDPIPVGLEELAALRERALAKPIYLDRILSRDGRKTGIFVTFQPIPDHVLLPVEKGFTPLAQASWPAERVILADRIREELGPGQRIEPGLRRVGDPRKLIAPALKVILDRHSHPDLRVTATGMPVLDFEIDRMTEREGTRFGLVALGTSVLLMLLLFRSVAGVTGPVLVIASTLVILYGLMGWLGFPVTLVSIVVSTLILVISVSYSIHVIHHIQTGLRRGGSRREAVRHGILLSAWPCFVTAATTSVGFASFLLVPIKPIRELGVLCSLGVFITYVLVMVLVPIGYSFGRDRPALREAAPASSSSRLMQRWADLVAARPRTIGAASAGLVGILLLLTLRVGVDTDFMKVLGERVPFVRDSMHVAENLGGLYSYEVLVELPEAGMATEPEVLEALDRISREIDRWPSTAVTTSVTDLLKDIHLSLQGGGAAEHRIPGTRERVAQYLLLYEMAGGESLEDWMDDTRRFLRVSVQVKASSTAMARCFDKVRAIAAGIFPQGTEVRIVGEIPLMVGMVNLLSHGQVTSVLAAFGVITLLMIAILRSVPLGLISMIPNTFPVLVIGGMMGLAKIPLDMVTVMVMPMIIGIAVDDTVHYILHFQQEYRRTGSYLEANRGAFQKAGKAILFTSVILALGFLIFALSDMRSLVSMAVLSSAGILAALAADLVITPALFVALKPWGRSTLLAVQVPGTWKNGPHKRSYPSPGN